MALPSRHLASQRKLRSLLLSLYRRYWFSFSPVRSTVRRHVAAFFAGCPTDGPVLEVGAGTGMMVPTLRRASGVDWIVRSDLEPSDHTDVACAGGRLPFPDGTFAMVAAFEVLEHVADTKGFLDELRRVSRPGGYVIISVPFLLGRHDHRDYFRFTPDGLERVLATSGLRMVSIRGSGGISLVLVNLLCEYLRTIGVAPAQGWRSRDRRRRLQLAARTVLTMPLVGLSWVAISLDRLIDPDSDGPSGLVAIAVVPVAATTRTASTR